MDWELIWARIREYAVAFYDFAMTQGENKFMLVDNSLIYSRYVSEETQYFFVGSFIVMAVLAILACDSFRLLHPIVEIREWKYKISIVKVVIFSAAVFSLHTFYKMLMTLGGRALHAEASVAALDCLGTYINPISLMIYAYAVSTMTFRKGRIQALFLGWAIFLTPAAMSYSNLTDEHLMLYIVAGFWGILGAICYQRFSPYIACFMMYIGYFAAKFFMIYYSEEVLLLSADHGMGKFGQYMACMQMDGILCMVLLLILLGYKEITTEKGQLRIKKDIVFAAIIAVFMTGTMIFNNVAEVQAIQVSRAEPSYYIEEDEDAYLEQDDEEGTVEEGSGLALFMITAEAANIRSGPGTDYAVVMTVSRGTEFYGTGNEATAENGRVWYEIYLDYDYIETAWASGAVIEALEKQEEQENTSAGSLTGSWIGDQGSELILSEEGECYYKDGISGEGSGTWEVDDYDIIHIKTSALSYDLYASLDDGYHTTAMLVEADSVSWINEEFVKQD